MDSFVRRFRDLLRSLCTFSGCSVGRIKRLVILLRLLVEIDEGRLAVDRILDRKYVFTACGCEVILPAAVSTRPAFWS